MTAPGTTALSASADPNEDAGLTSPQEVVDFWFGVPGSPDWMQTREAWFRKDSAFDALIESRFGGLLQRALHGKLEADRAEQDQLVTKLSRIIVCDQFSRNVWRGRPKSFALDPIALATSNTLIDTPEERSLPAVQRMFVYLPLMHCESVAEQARCVRLFQALAAESSLVQASLDSAVRHEAVIRRFARFPHRNEILGRHSTDEEIAFLKEPGSRF